MLTKAVEYPTEREDWLPTVLIGGGLWLAVMLCVVVAWLFLAFWFFLVTIPIGLFFLVLAAVPFLLLLGFTITVSRAIMDGRELPPTFDAWGQYAKDGLNVLAISLVYGLPLIALGVLAAFGIGIGAFVGGDGGGMLMVLTALFAMFLGSAVGLVVLYFYPAALFNFARTGELGSIVDVEEMRRISFNADYAFAWVLAAITWVAGRLIGDALLFIIVGVFVYFYAQLVATYLITRGGMDALDLDAPGLEPAAAATLQPETPDVPTDEDTPAPTAGRPSTEPGRDVHKETGPTAVSSAEPSGDAEASTPPPTDDLDHAPDDDLDDDLDSAADEPAIDEAPTEDERDLEDVNGVGPSKAEALREAGFETVGDLRAASADDLAEVEGLGPSLAERIKTDVGDET